MLTRESWFASGSCAERENLFLVHLRPNAASLHCEHQHPNTFDFLIAWLFWFSFRYTLHIANTVDLVQLSTTDASNDRGISLPFVSFHLKYKFGCLYLNSIWIISFTICSLFLYIGVTLSCCYETVYWNILIQFSREFAFASVAVAVVSRLGSAWDKEGI